MIVFLTVIYVVLLFILIKLKVAPNTKWTWFTIIPYVLILLIGFFLPMQWGAPAGDVVVLERTVQIVPNVAGQVVEVAVGPNQRVEKGEVLFRIDPRPFQYKVDQLKAQLREAHSSLKLAKIEIDRTRRLAKQSAAAQREVDQWQARYDGSLATIQRIKAQIQDVEYNWAQRRGVAPADGIGTTVAAGRRGARVVAFPAQQAMAFIDDSKRILAAQIHQIYLRHVKAGQRAEVVFKLFPGQVFAATVEHVVPGIGSGQVPMSGRLPMPQPVSPGPFFVRLVLDDEAVAKRLPAGAVGTVAIYTSHVRVSHIIREVMIRVEAILNYVKPT